MRNQGWQRIIDWMRLAGCAAPLLCLSISASQGAEGVRITEFMAANNTALADEDGDFSDWIEIHNAGTAAVNLLDWSLTDNPANFSKWRFPAINLAANAYLVVFASEKNRRVPGAPLHTNFKLAAGGEYLALVRPGTNIASAFAPTFPPQVSDVSYGLGTVTVPTTLIETGALARVNVPSDEALGLSWADPAFDDSAWAAGPTGVGYQTTATNAADFRALIRTDLQSQMFRSNSSAFVRIPFELAAPPAFDHLTLQMKYDDGFVAYLNGVELVGDGDPISRAWNSAAARDRPDNEALVFADFNLDRERGLLRSGANVLAIHGLNATNNDPNFLILPKLVAATDTTEPNSPRYFTAPTPGAANGHGVADLGPIISDLKHTPDPPSDNDDLVVTARITPSFAPVAAVTMRYRVMYSNEVSVTMLDDGLSGDGAPGDGVYGATIPAAASAAGQMVRWQVSATDSGSRASRWPPFADPLGSPEYLGTMVSVTFTSNLPTLHWFVENPALAETDTGTRCSLFFNGEFYDNVLTHIRGQASRGYPKKSHKFDFNPGHRFCYDSREERVEEINLNTTYADKSFVRVTLAWESFRDSGAPYCTAFPMRLQQNNAFYSVATFLEEPDETMLKRNGLDPNGAFYKMFNSLETAAGNQKNTRLQEDFSDLRSLVDGIRPTNSNRVQFLFDNVNIPAMLHYLAVIVVIHDNDCPHKNYWMYRDTDGTREWRMFPWDKDLCLGRNFNGLTDDIWANLDVVAGRPNVSPSHPFFMDQRHQKLDFQWNRLVDALYNTPAILEMYRRHLRTVMEQLLQPPDTPQALLKYERRMNELFAQMEPDVALDRAKWRYEYGAEQSFATGLDAIRTNYLPARRVHLFNTHSLTNAAYGLCARLPLPQLADASILFGAIEYNPASGNQAEEYLELVNTNHYAVDLSGWKLSGAIRHTFQPGVVLPARSSLYVSPNVVAFRARTTGPRGGQGLFVQGNYQGQLSARGETVRLVDSKEREVSALTYAGDPSPAQQYLRITELMYHPAAPAAGGAYTAEDFEYLELKNIGPVTLDLAGVWFTGGIDFAFSGSAVTNLAPGQRILVVKNTAAFASRYGGGLAIAGQYLGNLDNSGENLRLEDALGEKVLEFSYDNSWYPVTDGFGFSLVIVDETASFDTWGSRTSWRPGGVAGGSPGQGEPVPTVLTPVVISEILTHTVPPQVDVIELFNPSTNAADISGWFLTDDFNAPRKYQFPPGSLIPPGNYLVLDETAFNPTPGIGTSFALSSNGEEVWLFSAVAAGNLTGYAHGFGFGAAEAGVSFGPYRTGLGEEHIVARSAFTPGMTNTGPKVGPIVITEVMYHPPELGVPPADAPGEYLELHNLTDLPVELFEPAHPTNTWLVSGEVDFTFPTNVTLSAGGYLLLVSFDPATNAEALATFRGRYGVAVQVPIFGPYRGKLDNSAGQVALSKPGAPVPPTATDAGFTPHVLVDQVDYADAAPWPADADGFGPSLQRANAALYGNDPGNWTAAAPSPGAAYGDGGLPSILVGPAHQNAVITGTASFSVEAAGAGPLFYQWRLNGVNVPGATQATLLLTNVQPEHPGHYSVMVYNAVGAVVSEEARLTANFLPIITRQPQPTNVFLGGTATFTLEALGTGRLHYQWLFNGAPLVGQTNNSLTLTNVNPVYDGQYSVVVTDDVGSVSSGAGTLITLILPQIAQQPQSQTVVQGDTVTFSVLATGTSPFGYRWRRGQSTLVPFGQGRATLTLTNVQFSDANVYTVVVTNLASIIAMTAGVLSSPAVLTVLADFDGDHLPDAWELANGLATNNAADALLDFDGDGLSNFQEYVAGTDPADAGSVLKLHASVIGADSVLEWLAVSNKTYTIRFKESWNVGKWYNLLQLPAHPSNRVERVPDPYPMTAGRLYRVATPQLPDPAIPEPIILQSPRPIAVSMSEDAGFGVIAVGLGALGYQWRFNQSNLAGANEAVLRLTNITVAEAGDYAVTLTDTRGSTTTEAARLSVKPLIISHPQSQHVIAGQTATFSVLATGARPLTYVWTYKSRRLAGQTNSMLILPDVQPSHAGPYRVHVGHITPVGYETISSQTARLSVSDTP